MKNSFSKFVPASLLIAFLVVMAPPNQAQVPTTMTQVYCSPDGPEFFVDGGEYAHAMSAFWPVGSKHTLTVAQGTGISYNQNKTIMFAFSNWQWAGGTFSGPTIQVTADTNIPSYVATFGAQYLFSIQFFTCTDAPSCAQAPGIITMNGSPITSDVSLWQSPGAGITLQAFPNDGWVFAGWRAGANQVITGFQDQVTLNAPMTVYPVFVPAKNVTFATNPANMKVYADGVLLETPDTLQWGETTSHSIAALPVQNDSLLKPYVFLNWSDGGALSHNYTVASNATPETITANYTPAVHASFTTVPGNLTLTVDGQTMPPPYAYLWGVGIQHTVTAPLTQTDAQGGVWQFQKWDDGVTTATRTYTPTNAQLALGLGNVAFYTGQAHVTVSSSVPGASVTIDGASCATPCTVLRAVGAQIHVSTPASIAMGAGSRQDFLGWSANGGALSTGDWTGTVNDSTLSLTASYHLLNHLSATANPATGVQWAITPQSADGFYDSQAQVNVSVTAQPGFHFTAWSGDLTGSVPSGTLAMTAPRNVVAQLNAVPYVSAPALNNAAGTTPQQTVAPGSVASIYGVNLATNAAMGEPNLLPQTLAGVTVHMGTNYLPLYFASPTQINLQVPPDLQPGTQTITVSPAGMPDVNANFTIARNAPGLFPMQYGDQTYALALHADGTLVTPDSPASRGEQITIYGTGFGPTDHTRPFGYPVPATPAYKIVDPTNVLVAGTSFAADSAYALPGSIGIDVVQVTIDSTVNSGAAVSFQVNVNGINSNTLPIPIR